MCGICGAVSLGGPLGENIRRALPAMTAALHHRGPDGDGFYDGPTAVLGHRRLSIIDRAGGAQPMTNEDGTIWVVFNGEIYNHRDLRVRLEANGHVFRTSSDTEAILHGYEEWGEAVAEYLEGMFAFAVYSERTREVLLARDRVGKKPLFYAVLDGVLHFGSEIKALQCSPAWDDAIDSEAIESYLSLGYILAPRTIYRHVRKLLPGHTLRLAAGDIRVCRFWDVREFDSDHRDEGAVLGDLDSMLRCAVTDRLESEVPLGAFLSGGIDSGLVVSYMAEALPRVVTTSVGFGDTTHNELDAAALTALHLKTDHYPEQVEPVLGPVLDSIARSFDEPFADSSAVPTQYVSALARTHVTVALSGDGGDEVFGGYGFRYIPHLLEDRARRVTAPLGLAGFLRASGRAWPRGTRVPRWLRAGTYLENIGGSAADAYYEDVCFLKPAATYELMGLSPATDYRTREPFGIVSDAYLRCGSKDPVQRAQYADLHIYLPNDPLVKVDRMSMLNSLEIRSPLLDHRAIEMAFKIPRPLKLKHLEAKYLLRTLARRRLPAPVLAMPKRGFTAPVSRWITQNADELRESALSQHAVASTFLDVNVARRWLDEHVTGRMDRAYPLWALWMLQKWRDNCLVRPQTVRAVVRA
jgi:asparagine synthase (glutamine-hydrolysing)